MDTKTLGEASGDVSDHAQLNAMFRSILAKDSDASRRLFVSIAFDLRQFHLDKQYDVAFILNEVYLRACRTVENGKTIPNVYGWIRLTARNIVRELSRNVRKNDRLPEGLDIEDVSGGSSPLEVLAEESSDERTRLNKAFATLSKLEQQVLYLKVVDGLRWKEIRNFLIEEGMKPMSENHLSQLKRRALKKLKQAFSQV